MEKSKTNNSVKTGLQIEGDQVPSHTEKSPEGTYEKDISGEHYDKDEKGADAHYDKDVEETDEKDII